MRILKMFIFLSVVALCSCKGEGKKEEAVSTDTVSTMKMITDSNVITAAIDTVHTANNSLDWDGTYKGTLPCSDCEGIETELQLNKDMTYAKTTRYLGKKVSIPSTAHVTFIWKDGSHVFLQGLTNEPSTYFVAENKIFQLDMQGKKVEGSLADKYTLTKIK